MRDDISGPREPGNVLPFGTIDRGKTEDASIITSIRAEMDRYHAYILHPVKNPDGSKRSTLQCRISSRLHHLRNRCARKR